jgi:hypothetical protein
MAKVWMAGMNATAMDQFMTDLRSGLFEQARGVLKSSTGGMCCLGVATDRVKDVVGLKEITGKVLDRSVYRTQDKGVDTTALMPIVVMDYLGIPHAYRDAYTTDGSILVVAHEGEEWSVHDRIVDGKPMIDVICLNDNLKKSFAEIADRFEETFKVEEES